MEGYFQAAAAVCIAVILSITLDSHGKTTAMLLSLAVCAMVWLVAGAYLRPVLEFLQQLQALGDLDSELVRTIVKCVGICLISEVAALICADAGKSSMGRTLHMLTGAAVLWLSIPVFQSFLELIQKILEEV